MKWSEMSDRERDALVAEQVMGYEGRFLCRWRKNEGKWLIAFTHNPDSRMGTYRRLYRDDGEKLYCGRPHQVHFPPHYSKGIAAAWEVVGAFPDFSFAVGHAFNIGSGERAGFFAHFGNSHANAPHAPEAICLAALRAVGVEIEP